MQTELLPDYRGQFNVPSGGTGMRERRAEASPAWAPGTVVFAFDAIRSTLPPLPANADDVIYFGLIYLQHD